MLVCSVGKTLGSDSSHQVVNGLLGVGFRWSDWRRQVLFWALQSKERMRMVGVWNVAAGVVVVMIRGAGYRNHNACHGGRW